MHGLLITLHLTLHKTEPLPLGSTRYWEKSLKRVRQHGLHPVRRPAFSPSPFFARDH